MVNLGDKVKDVVTGLTGIAVGRTQYLQGCARFAVQPQELKDGKPVEASWFDEPQLEVIEAGAIKLSPPISRITCKAKAAMALSWYRKARKTEIPAVRFTW